MRITDAFRGPLYEAFKLLDVVRNYQEPNSLQSLGQICLHVEAVKKSKRNEILPEYSCLVLSPANFWKQNAQQFVQDASVLNTIFEYQVCACTFFFYICFNLLIVEFAKGQSVNGRNAFWNAYG